MSLWTRIVNAERSILRALGFNPPPDEAEEDTSAPQVLQPLASTTTTTAPTDDPIVGPAFSWLAKWTPADRRALLDAQRAVGLDPKIGGLLVVIDHESGGKPDALNALPAAGLIQLTVGANLPGFATADAVRAVATWSPERQAHEVITPFYKRMFPHGATANQSGVALLRKNFLPALADKDAGFVLGVKEGASGPNGETSEDVISGKLTRGAIYKSNAGFDHAHRGYFTWADVDAQAQAAQGAVAKRGWMRVSGAIEKPGDPAMAGAEWLSSYGPRPPDGRYANCPRCFVSPGSTHPTTCPFFGRLTYSSDELRDGAALLCLITRDAPTRRRHAHKCRKCGHVWWHDSDACIGRHATEESCEAAHVCDNCGAEQRYVCTSLCGTENTMSEDPNMGAADFWKGQPAIWTIGGVQIDATNLDGAKLRSVLRPDQRALLPAHALEQADAIHARIEVSQLLKSGAKIVPSAQYGTASATSSASEDAAGSMPLSSALDPGMGAAIRGQSAADAIEVSSPDQEYAWLESQFGTDFLWQASHAVHKMGRDVDQIDIIRNGRRESYYFHIDADPLDPAMAGASYVPSWNYDEPTWVWIDLPGGYKAQTTAEPLSRDGVRVPMSFNDALSVAEAMRAIPPTRAIVDARWRQAQNKTIAFPVASKDGAHMNDAAQNAEFAKHLGPVGTVLREGGWKSMILDPLGGPLKEGGPGSMVFYGWAKPGGGFWQKGISSDHNNLWIEYDSLVTLTKRDAIGPDGQPVDLLDVIRNGGPVGGPVPEFIARRLGGEASPLAALAGDGSKA